MSKIYSNTENNRYSSIRNEGNEDIKSKGNIYKRKYYQNKNNISDNQKKNNIIKSKYNSEENENLRKYNIYDDIDEKEKKSEKKMFYYNKFNNVESDKDKKKTIGQDSTNRSRISYQDNINRYSSQTKPKEKTFYSSQNYIKQRNYEDKK